MAFAAAVLCSCTRLSPLTIVADPAWGHPCAEDGGLCVNVDCSGGISPYTIDFGDGTEPIRCSGIAMHTYEPPYATSDYEIRVSCEDGWGATTVSIFNHPPQFHGIFTVGGGTFAERELVLLRVGFFVMGCADCDNDCGPYGVYGGSDPDGDPLVYELHIRRQGFSVEDSIFDLEGNRVNGRSTSGDFLVWFPAWRSAIPPFPFAPLEATSLHHINAAVPMTPTDEAISPKGNFFTYNVSVKASDPWGGSCSYETMWEVMEMER